MPDAAAPARIARPDGWQILKRNRAAVVALWFLAGLSLVAIVGPMLLPAALKSTSNASFVPPMQSAAETASLHVLGTDVNGQDMLYRIFSGARVSLGVGLLGALISLFIGTLYGMISGYVGGRVDAIMMRTVEILQSIPRILVIMMLIAALDDYVKEWVDGWRLMAQAHNWTTFAEAMNSLKAYSKVLVMIVSLGIVEWLTMARIVRGQVLVLREMTFVTASRAMGQGSWGVLRRHLLPNLSTIILTYLTLTIPAVILDESFLSFLGLGIEDPASSWGSLLKDGAPAINPIESKWWLLLFPALFMSASLLALNFLGDGLRDAFDPKSGE